MDSSKELSIAPCCSATDETELQHGIGSAGGEVWVLTDTQSGAAGTMVPDGDPVIESLQFQSRLIFALHDAAIGTDTEFRVMLINDAAAALFGVSAVQAVGRSIFDAVDADLSEVDLPTAHHQLVTTGCWSGRVRKRSPDGLLLHIDVTVTLVRDDLDHVQGTLCVARDVTRSRAAERDAADRAEFATTVLESLPGRTCVVDRDGTVIAVNRRYRHEGPSGAGPGTGPRIGADYLQWLASVADDESVKDLRRLLAGECHDCRTEFGAVRRRRRHWTELSAVPLRGQDGGSVITHTDITVRKQNETTLTQRATHDPLTGLPNRTLLSDRLAHALSRAARNGGQVGILFCDLDGLRAVNNSFGHTAGDRLLITIAKRLRAVCRSSDTVARVSGDEFVVILEDAENRTQVEDAAQRIIDALGEPVTLNETVAKTGASIGLLLSPGVQRPGVRTVEKLIGDADAAMYAAKERGRGRFVWFSPEMREHPSQRPSFVQTINRLLNR